MQRWPAANAIATSPASGAGTPSPPAVPPATRRIPTRAPRPFRASRPIALSCHDERGFSPATFSVERHRTSAYPLEGKHASVKCSSCHRKEAPAAAGSAGQRAGRAASRPSRPAPRATPMPTVASLPRERGRGSAPSVTRWPAGARAGSDRRPTRNCRFPSRDVTGRSGAGPVMPSGEDSGLYPRVPRGRRRSGSPGSRAGAPSVISIPMGGGSSRRESVPIRQAAPRVTRPGHSVPPRSTRRRMTGSGSSCGAPTGRPRVTDAIASWPMRPPSRAAWLREEERSRRSGSWPIPPVRAATSRCTAASSTPGRTRAAATPVMAKRASSPPAGSTTTGMPASRWGRDTRPWPAGPATRRERLAGGVLRVIYRPLSGKCESCHKNRPG